MIARTLIAMSLLGALMAPAAAAPTQPEARIRNMGAYLEAVPDPQRGVFIRDYRGHWYYAGVVGNCPRLTRSAALRFDASPGGYFDRNSAIRADGWRCLIASVTASDAPPRHRRR